uniref:NAD-dependent epimerase/dehydratase domain-containing protein n=1 Tax=Quercus lobata TaxID=97700 RepID=A0A7N2R455_QUELO
MFVYSIDDPKKTDRLLLLDGAKERLKLFKANLLEEGSFDSVVDECVGVFHTASPVFLAASDPQAELIDPAVKGTLNVLKSCSKFSSIKRFIVTSSIVAIMCSRKPLTPVVILDETWFSDPVTCEESKLWYVLSKTLAEEAAWKFAKENGIDMITMNPGPVIGPLLQSTTTFSVDTILNLINVLNNVLFSRYLNCIIFVDIRDVENAHIQAFETPSASGRYCLVERVTPHSETQDIG